MSQVTVSSAPSPPRHWRGLLAGLAAPTAWLAQIEANYALVPWACAHRNRSVFLLVSLAALAVSVWGGLFAWRSWPHPEPLTGEPMGIEGPRLLFLLGVVMSLSFTVVVIASAVPALLLSPCE
jgi:hydrogenase/urease accessory protein HupE